MDYVTAVLTCVSTVQQHQRSSAALQESAQTLQRLCGRQVDLIQQDPVALLHCLSQRPLQRKTPAAKAPSAHLTAFIGQPALRAAPLTRCIRALYLHEGEDHGRLTGADLLLSLAQLDGQRLPPLLQQGSYTSAKTT